MQGASSEYQPPRETIAELVEALEPVRPAGRTAGRGAVWLALGWLAVVAGVLVLAPLRPGALAELGSSPQFLLESVLGLGAGILLASAGFALCIPGSRPLRQAAPAALLLTLWVGTYLYALWDPALPPTMAGKRALCEVQILALGVALLVAALWLARGLATLHPVWSGALLGAAAGSIPALFMQFACAYLLPHALTHHVLPALALSALAALIAPRVLRGP